MEFICSFSLRPVLAMRMYKFYGERALELLREDPYLLASFHIGGSFYEADRLALDLGLEEENRSRVNAAVYGGGRHTWPLQMDSRLERIDGQWKITWTKASTY